VSARDITARRLVSLYVGSVLGAGVLVVPGITVVQAGWGAIVVWLLLGLVCAAVAIVFADIATRFPRASGMRDLVVLGIGRPAAAYVDCALVFVYVVGNPAMGLASAEYLSHILGVGLPLAWTAAAFMALALMMSLLPARTVSAIQTWAMRVALLSMLLAFCAAAPDMSLQHISDSGEPDLEGSLAALGVAFYAYLGWENVSLLAGKVAEPHRSFRYAIWRAVPIVAGVYLLATVAYAALPSPGSELLVPALVERLPGALQVPLLLGSLTALVAATSAWVLGGAHLFEDVGRRWGRDVASTPAVARLALGAGYAAMLAGVARGWWSITELLAWTSCLFMAVYALVAVADTRLRRRLNLTHIVLIGSAATLLAAQRWIGLLVALTCVTSILTRERASDARVHPRLQDQPGGVDPGVRNPVPESLPRERQ
jgi:amino acid efflux transporter